MRKLEAVIFDWAGTTVDYGCFAPVQAFVEVFREFGIDPTMDETRKPMGMLKRDHIKTMLEMPRIQTLFQQQHGRAYTEADLDEMYHGFETKLMGILHQFSDPKPHVLETVAALREMGLKIGSTTGYTDQMMEIVCPTAAQKGYAPDCWFSPNSTNNLGRPYPFMLFKNLEALKVSCVQNVIKVGDTVSDILEGKNAGVISVGVLEGSSEMALTQDEFQALDQVKRQELEEKVRQVYQNAGADYVIQSMKELPALIRQIV